MAFFSIGHATRTIVASCLLLVCAAPLPSLDFRPFVGPDAKLQRSINERHLAFWRTLTVEVYRGRGLTDPQRDAEVLQLLEATCAALSNTPSDLPLDKAMILAKRLNGTSDGAEVFTRWAEFTLACQRARRKGRGGGDVAISRWASFFLDSRRHVADDELVHLCYRFLVAWDSTRDANGKPAWDPPLSLDPYLYCLYTHLGLREPKVVENRIAVTELAVRIIEGMIRSGTCRQVPDILLDRIRSLEIIGGELGDRVVASLDAAADTSDLEPWLAAGIKAAVRFRASSAWKGLGWGTGPSPEGWRRCGLYLQEAETWLVKAWQLHPHEPVLAAIGITISSVSQAKVSRDEWFKRGISLCPDHNEVLNSMLAFGDPNWGGNYPAMLALACDAMDAGRFDSDLPTFALDVLRDVLNSSHQLEQVDAARTALAAPRVEKAMRACVDGLIARDPTSAVRYRCILAAYHWHAGKPDLARAAIRGIPHAELNSLIETSYYVSWESIRGAEDVPPAKVDF
jgi:hypothetical protein